LAFVAAVAERQIGGVAAPANRYDCPAAETERLAFLIHNLKITFNPNWSIVENRQFGSSHEFLRKISIVCTRCAYKIAGADREYKTGKVRALRIY
jgi:hypothetical protein